MNMVISAIIMTMMIFRRMPTITVLPMMTNKEDRKIVAIARAEALVLHVLLESTPKMRKPEAAPNSVLFVPEKMSSTRSLKFPRQSQIVPLASTEVFAQHTPSECTLKMQSTKQH